MQTKLGIEWREGIECLPAADAWKLLHSTYWAANRDVPIVQRKLEQSTVVLSAWEDGALVAMCRVVCVDQKVNWLYDVVVDEQRRGQGLGTALMQRVVAHPALQDCRLFLDTRDAMPLYARFGFEEVYRKRDSSLMVLDRRPS